MAETIIFGGQKLDIDPNDELWKQLVDKYSKKNQTGWEEPKYGDCVYTLYGNAPQCDYNLGPYRGDNQCAQNNAALFTDCDFARMQAHAEIIRRKMLRWAADNDKPLGLHDTQWGVNYDEDRNKWIAIPYYMYPNLFGVYFSSEEVALEAAQYFSDDLKWMIFEYKRRLDEVNE